MSLQVEYVRRFRIKEDSTKVTRFSTQYYFHFKNLANKVLLEDMVKYKRHQISRCQVKLEKPQVQCCQIILASNE